MAGKSDIPQGENARRAMHACAPMKFVLCLSFGFVLLAPIDAGAQSDDLAYCNTLYDLAVRYRGSAIMGQSKPDIGMIAALEQCKSGDSAAGIATLEQKLRNGKIDLPPRQ